MVTCSCILKCRLSLASSIEHKCGSSCTNALSEKFVVLSRVTKENYDKSIPIVKDVWNSFGPRSKGDIYYYLEYNKG